MSENFPRDNGINGQPPPEPELTGPALMQTKSVGANLFPVTPIPIDKRQ